MKTMMTISGADTGHWGHVPPVSKKKEEEGKRGKKRGKRRGEREIMLVSYYNLNNEVWHDLQ